MPFGISETSKSKSIKWAFCISKDTASQWLSSPFPPRTPWNLSSEFHVLALLFCKLLGQGLMQSLPQSDLNEWKGGMRSWPPFIGSTQWMWHYCWFLWSHKPAHSYKILVCFRHDDWFMISLQTCLTRAREGRNKVGQLALKWVVLRSLTQIHVPFVSHRKYSGHMTIG